MGRYEPAFSPGALYGAARGESTDQSVGAQWGHYKGQRADDASATQAIEGLQTQIENHLFNQPLRKDRR